MAIWCKLTETTEAGVMSLPSYPFNDYRPRTQQVNHLEPFFIVTKTLHSRVHPVYAIKKGDTDNKRSQAQRVRSKFTKVKNLAKK